MQNTTPTTQEMIFAVCNRLEIPTRGDYAQHMSIAIESLREEVDLNVCLKTLSKYAERMRHCDFFDILYRMLFEDRNLEEAIDIVMNEYVDFARYDSSEFYDFMFSVGRESQYFELEKNQTMINSNIQLAEGPYVAAYQTWYGGMSRLATGDEVNDFINASSGSFANLYCYTSLEDAERDYNSDLDRLYCGGKPFDNVIEGYWYDDGVSDEEVWYNGESK